VPPVRLRYIHHPARLPHPSPAFHQHRLGGKDLACTECGSSVLQCRQPEPLPTPPTTGKSAVLINDRRGTFRWDRECECRWGLGPGHRTARASAPRWRGKGRAAATFISAQAGSISYTDNAAIHHDVDGAARPWTSQKPVKAVSDRALMGILFNICSSPCESVEPLSPNRGQSRFTRSQTLRSYIHGCCSPWLHEFRIPDTMHVQRARRRI
ncbi:hypothetical protein C8R45DRAFT_1155033, partial [Mycena sanguinolenta]